MGVTRLTAALLLLGIVVLAALVLYSGPLTLVDQLRKLGGNLLWVLVPSIAIYLFDALGWRATLGRHAERIRFGRLFMIRMAGEAVNFSTPAAYLGGEPMKAYLLSRYGVPLVDGLASVVTAKTTMTLAQVLFILIGVAATFALLNRSSELILTGLVGLMMLGFGIGVFMAVQRRGLFVGISRLLERIGLRIRWLKEREKKLEALDEAISDFYSRDRRGFISSLLYFFIGWVIGAAEVYLILYLLGEPRSFLTAFAIEALAVFVKGGTSFIPGSVGGQEAGTVMLFVAFGYTSATGVTFAIVRRFREILWLIFGLLALAAENRRARQSDPGPVSG